MPEKPAQHWTDSLFDSVSALYEMAHEYQIALRAAEVTASSVDFDRRKSHEGRIALEGRTSVYGRTYTRPPHDYALMLLSHTYGEAASLMRRRYTEASLLFASGAAWAVRSVHAGEQPPVVAFETDKDGDWVLRALHTPDLDRPDLDRYAGAADLAAAYDQLRRCMDADEYGEELAGRDEVSEQEAGAMFDAHAEADGLADAAFAYGLLAQKAVSFVLLEPRRARERERALARAEAQRTENAAPGDAQA
ncbi:hypothetical protein IFE09_11160 [Streptomyces microflavus]|uniref:hypothetical protein n=1 Tax=Streptomyces microflavus TaxID=1919 RepID=UPI00192C1BBD|nr:hypothetical protein [Streptomyces microflavus]QQZ54116.1 hypothetical protein IFE09_11160 [Streptomyces microflavus]WSS36672.1 hypothetical protein OG269_25945 [Streptomyces microflavus]